MFCNDSLFAQIEEDFELMYTHNFRYSELDNMLPWEREVYISFIKRKIEEHDAK